jgi:hypothetical protein
MKKTIDPSKYTFVYRLTDGECHKELTGTCSLDKKTGKGDNGESGVAYCQRLYRSLVQDKQFFPVYIVKATCGHFEFSDGQHRVCIAQRTGLKLKAVVEDMPEPCRICKPRESEMGADYDDVILVDVDDFVPQLFENQPGPEVIPKFKFQQKRRRKTNGNNKNF